MAKLVVVFVVKMARPKRPDDGIEQFFSASEFQEMSDYEKLRLRNMKANYEMMVEVGKQHHSLRKLFRVKIIKWRIF